ncbi:hypothetical protein [Oceanobacillus kapialis]|uniref:Uncharacterized protein n=2 Tax=Oceanobacillus kapialis TaxID=481353 RepID=A0ABW5Q4C2_9BACI
MRQRTKIMRAVKYTGAVVLVVGIVIFLYGFFVSDGGRWTAVGIGTVMGAVFLFLMGVFFVGTEEKLKDRYGRFRNKFRNNK